MKLNRDNFQAGSFNILFKWTMNNSGGTNIISNQVVSYQGVLINKMRFFPFIQLLGLADIQPLEVYYPLYDQLLSVLIKK